MKVRTKRHPHGQEEFDIELSEELTLLELLILLKEMDETLAFRSMCRAGICGTCAVRLNGKPVLACNTRINPEEENLLVEPLNSTKVIRDLVVENEDTHHRLRKSGSWLQPWDWTLSVEEDVNRKTSKSWDCILCGICDSVCPVLQQSDSFGGPLVLTRLYKHILDPRNGGSMDCMHRALELRPDLCTHCMNCSYACPKRLMPENLIRQTESMLVEKGLLQRTGGFDFLGF